MDSEGGQNATMVRGECERARYTKVIDCMCAGGRMVGCQMGKVKLSTLNDSGLRVWVIIVFVVSFRLVC